MQNKQVVKVVCVTWRDAYFDDSYKTIEELTAPFEMKSYGVVIHEDDDSIVLSMEYNPEVWMVESRYAQHIPKINVKSIEVIKEVEEEC